MSSRRSNKEFARRGRLELVFAGVVACHVLAFSGEAFSNDEIACPGGDFTRSGAFAGTGPDQKPEGWKVLVVQPPKSPFGGFLVHGNKLLIVDHQTLICTNLQGERIWEADVAIPGIQPPHTWWQDEPSGQMRLVMRYPLHQLIGWRDMVIAVGLDGAVKAFALGDGRLLWSSPGPELNDEKSAVWEERSMEERLPPPVVYKNNLFLGGDRVIRRLSLEDGNELKPFGFLEEEKERVLFTSPLVASDSALFFTTGLEKTFTGHFQAIDLESGQTMWTHKWGRSKNTILVVDKKLIIVGNRSAGMSRLPRSGLFMFEHELGVDLPTKISCKSTADKPVVHQGAFLLADRLRVVKMDVKSGRELWNYRSRKLFLPLLVVGGNVIYVTDSSGSVHAINASDGNSLWVCETKETPIPGKDIPLVPSNGALFRLTLRGIEVLGSPVVREQAPVVVGGKPSDPAAIRKEIESIDRQIGEFREEWQECKQLLAEPQASGGESDESMKKRETAGRRIREIAEAVPQLKARRAELEKQLK